MSHRTSTDNRYKEGTVIAARLHPDVKLTIMKYYQRIYYCAHVSDPGLKHLAYFERELIAAGALHQ